MFHILVFLLITVLMVIIGSNFFGKKVLIDYSNIQDVSTFDVIEESLKIIKLDSEIEKEDRPKFIATDRGLFLEIIDELGVNVYFEYWIYFSFKGESFLLKHHAALKDWNNDSEIYKEYFYSNNPSLYDPAGLNLKNMSFWVASNLGRNLSKYFADNLTPIDVFGEDIVKDLRYYLNFIVAVDYL
ncbi:hypothetical protein [Photobacterium nomapromontoriensis]|uniref:hypothetical protein n=1 Tax=Photobacterium nomapromontoriensis TaxID=2910237 RepID=UPI003D1473F0